ncbi:hypothetical protein ACS0TY_017586 [Phlomoides rotata]
MDSLGSGSIKKRSATQLDENHERKDPNKRQNLTHPFLMPLLPIPKLDEWCLGTSIVLTGTASKGLTGPPIGVVDIGVAKSAYYFCVAVPGVKRNPSEFSCEIQRDGKVCIQGITTTGGDTVTKFSRVFTMEVQQLCPPGPFRLFFSLPGPVDPRLFSATFRLDGIFEGIVARNEQ